MSIVLTETSLLELNKLENEGRNLYNKNHFYRDIATCLENPEVFTFFHKYFSNPRDMDTILMFIKLYMSLYSVNSPNMERLELNGYQRIMLLDIIIRNKDMRQEICKKFVENTIPLNLCLK